MFKAGDKSALQKEIKSVEHNYTIQANDFLKLDVFTNEGERIIDPNKENVNSTATAGGIERPVVEYLVNHEGVAKFPMIGDLKVEGLTLRQAEEILQKEYSKFYQGAYVILQYMNKRVIVLGSPGGQVIPLTNQNIKLVEVLAMAKGIDNTGKARNIRVLRGDQVYVADLSTIEGYLKYNMIIEPGDIVYVEPVRKPLAEGLRDYGTMFSIFASFTTVLIVLLK
jgi:polysaccharide export outer membrane protein